jgi:hypothetical protein
MSSLQATQNVFNKIFNTNIISKSLALISSEEFKTLKDFWYGNQKISSRICQFPVS